MGRLKMLWAELRITTDPLKRAEIQKEINEIETWMIQNKIGTITETTNWTQQSDYGLDFEKRLENPNYPKNAGAVFIEDLP